MLTNAVQARCELLIRQISIVASDSSPQREVAFARS